MDTTIDPNAQILIAMVVILLVLWFVTFILRVLFGPRRPGNVRRQEHSQPTEYLPMPGEPDPDAGRGVLTQADRTNIRMAEHEAELRAHDREVSARDAARQAAAHHAREDDEIAGRLLGGMRFED